MRRGKTDHRQPLVRSPDPRRQAPLALEPAVGESRRGCGAHGLVKQRFEILAENEGFHREVKATAFAQL